MCNEMVTIRKQNPSLLIHVCKKSEVHQWTIHALDCMLHVTIKHTSSPMYKRFPRNKKFLKLKMSKIHQPNSPMTNIIFQSIFLTSRCKYTRANISKYTNVCFCAMKNKFSKLRLLSRTNVPQIYKYDDHFSGEVNQYL